jgi:hypothetical protein
VARRITILDRQNNRERIDIGVNPGNGDAYVALKDLEGKEHMTLVANWQGETTFLRVMDSNGKVRADMGVNQGQPFRNP